MSTFLEKLIVGVALGIGGAVLIVVLAVIMAWPIMWAWNYVMPYLFGFKTLTWSQAWCLNFLASCFFKSALSVKKSD